MKYFGIGLGLLALLLAVSLLALDALEDLSGDLVPLLEGAAERVLEEDIPQARALASQAEALWQGRRELAAALADHERLENIEEGFAELRLCAEQAAWEEYARGCVRIASRLRVLAEGEKLTWENFLAVLPAHCRNRMAIFRGEIRPCFGWIAK